MQAPGSVRPRGRVWRELGPLPGPLPGEALGAGAPPPPLPAGAGPLARHLSFLGECVLRPGKQIDESPSGLRGLKLSLSLTLKNPDSILQAGEVPGVGGRGAPLLAQRCPPAASPRLPSPPRGGGCAGGAPAVLSQVPGRVPFPRSSLPCCAGCRWGGAAAEKPPLPRHHLC